MAEPSAAGARSSSQTRPPAHRPSRRHLIVQAAVRVFARKGYADASIQDVAEEAEVVPTAIYYHFSGKEELFDAALQSILDATSAVARDARGDVAQPDADTLIRVIDAVWDWLEAHPDEAALMHGHLPGATPQARTMLREFEDRHVRRAFDYLGRSSASNHADSHALAVRSLIHLLIGVHALRMDGGPLSRYSPRLVRGALRDVARRIVLGS